ncbi:Ankyrin repeat and MYND domain-containing protein 1 [Tupaia chinensis]|uniref:Ankyrin repeat and MYND domain-containing protein 1 n=1 Tax=Tupaia chinensis TaxID=246437 RepID=L9KQS9_TUPCH|nr:Ankyrin repeat and MYND domain-containing protein 1 [Tupaia chinensis]
MEGGQFAFTSESEAPEPYSSRFPLEGKSNEHPTSEALRVLESPAVLIQRYVPEAPEEDEESEGTPRGQDLKEAYIQLIQGVQEWHDGCVYRGEFGLDMKLGYGEFTWPTGEAYRGQFFRDHRHGVGTYTWPDGSSFTGMFYLSRRDGYGTMFMKTRLFKVTAGPCSAPGLRGVGAAQPQGRDFCWFGARPCAYEQQACFGLYRADERFGPGVETYPDGSQDVGLWFREHLIKLCSELPSSFSLRDYPEFSAFLTHAPARVCLLEDRPFWDLNEERDPFFYEYKRFLLDDSLTLPPEMHVYSTDNCHLPVPHSFREELDSRIFVNDIPPFVEDGEPWFITNETPLLVRIQKQAYKFRNKKAHTSWNMGAILEGRRRGFARRGPLERLAKGMILKAEEGDYNWVYGILRDSLASADVADAKGYTALAAAAVHCHDDIIGLLLDCGADVNKSTDEGLTPLSMCFLLHYPSACFKANIAERTVPEPQDPAKSLIIRNLSFLFPEMSVESPYREVRGPSQDSPEPKQLLHVLGREDDGHLRGIRPSLESIAKKSSHGGSVGEAEKGLEDVAEDLDRSSLCSSETDFESDISVYNYSVVPSRGIVEKTAQAHSLLKGSSLDATSSDQETVRRLALSMTTRRNRWLTIKLLLRRGADPNLCRVPMQVLFFAVKAADVDGVRLLLESRARTDIRFPPQLRYRCCLHGQVSKAEDSGVGVTPSGAFLLMCTAVTLGALTPLHIAAALPGEEGVQITELLLHAITDVDAQAADQDSEYRAGKLDLPSSSLKLNNEPGPPSTYYSARTSLPQEGGRTALHVACEREDDSKCARDIVRLLLSHRANPNTLWSGHSPLSLSIASGNDLIVKELLSRGADPNLPLTKGLGSALCVACDLTYEHKRSIDGRLALIDRLLHHGADILEPVTLTQGDKVAVGTAVDYGYFKFFQDRKIAHCPFHALMPAERETFLARKRLLEYLGFQLRRAVLAKESQWDAKMLYLSKRAELIPSHRMKKKGGTLPRALDTEEHAEERELIPFFKFCYQCGRSVGVRLSPCAHCYGILTCGKYCKTRAWADFHRKDCGSILAVGSWVAGSCFGSSSGPGVYSEPLSLDRDGRSGYRGQENPAEPRPLFCEARTHLFQNTEDSQKPPRQLHRKPVVLLVRKGPVHSNYSQE